MFVEDGYKDGGQVEDFMGDFQKVASIPGGIEMLISAAAGQNPSGDKKQLRLFSLGGPVHFDSGGLAEAAEMARSGGRGDDDVLLHITPEEFEALQSMWGPPDINPVTGLPEYGFLSDIWKKVKGGVKKLVKSPLFSFLAPIALNVFAPGLGSAIGGMVGLGGKAGSVVGNTLLRSALGAAGGGKEGALAGAVSGLTTSGMGSALGSKLGLSGTAGRLTGDALIGGGASSLGGGDFGEGAVNQVMHSLIQPQLEGKVSGGLQKGRDLLMGAPNTADPILGQNTNLFPSTDEVPLGDTQGVLEGMNLGIPSSSEVPIDVPPGGWRGALGRIGDYVKDEKNIPQMLMAASVAKQLLDAGGGSGGGGAPPPPPGDNGNGDPLPDYDFNRTPQNGGLDYYTYGQTGADNPAEHNFFEGNGLSLPGAGPVTGEGVPPRVTGGGGGRRKSSPAPQNPAQMAMLQQQGWTFDPNTGMMYPPEDQNVIAAASGGHTRGPGSGRSDDIEALLSDGEYVMDAETVSMLGDGSNDEGARRLDEMREELRKHKGRAMAKGGLSPDAKPPMQYLAGGGRVSSLLSKYDSLSDSIRHLAKNSGDRDNDRKMVELYRNLKNLEEELGSEGLTEGELGNRARERNQGMRIEGESSVKGKTRLEQALRRLTELRAQKEFSKESEEAVEDLSRTGDLRAHKAQGGRMRTIRAAKTLDQLLGED